jgi:hypothetical protein
MSIAGPSASGEDRCAPNYTLPVAVKSARLLKPIGELNSFPNGSSFGDQQNARYKMLGTILLIILILLLIGGLPTWGYSTGWGYYPSGGIGLLLVIVIVLLLVGRI